MTRRLSIRAGVPALLCALALFSSSVSAATASVTVRDNAFDPARVGVSVGDAVTWTSVSTQRGHNVREDRKIFYSGPLSEAVDFAVVFSAGTFHYFCEAHGSRVSGMDGLVRVPARIIAAPQGAPFSVQWASAVTETGSQFDVQYRIGSGEWRNWQEATSTFERVFGKDAKPVRVQTGTRYRFRARSRAEEGASRWSPVRSFTP